MSINSWIKDALEREALSATRKEKSKVEEL